jgi:hypothetical protein
MLAATIVVASSAYHMPSMSTTIAGIEHGTSEVEVVTVWIAGIDAKMPEPVTPIEWTIEIGGCTEGTPLPVEQNIAHVQITALPIVSIYIVVTRYSHQIVEVDLIGSLVLLVGQIQLVSHFVRQEQGLVASLFVTHCFARCCHCQHYYQGYHHLLHIVLLFNMFDCLFIFIGKIRKKTRAMQRIFPKQRGEFP